MNNTTRDRFKRNNPHGNYLWDINEDTFISYNSTPGMGMPAFGADTGGDETALVLERKSDRKKYYILNGDFREEYSNAFDQDGIKGCCELYSIKSKEFGSTWTTASDSLEFLKGIIDRMAKPVDS